MRMASAIGDPTLEMREDFPILYEQKLKLAQFEDLEEYVSPDKDVKIEDCKPKEPTYHNVFAKCTV